MPHDYPDYLRLHTEEENPPAEPARPSFQAQESLCRSFEEATGWTLVEKTGVRNEPGRRPETAGPTLCGELLIEDMSAHWPAGKPTAPRVACDALVTALNEVLQELNRTRAALWQREAELATAIPVVPHREEEQHLSQRLEAVLRGAADGIACQAAALYLLDDATSQLKLRASYGLPVERYLEAARPLRGAFADLEALVGHAVVLEDARLLPHWHPPEDYPAGVCVPVSSATTPLGTLWVFCDHTRDFSSQETELLEIVAGRIVAELEREALLAQASEDREPRREITLAASWQQDRLPNVEPIIDDLQLSGWTAQAEMIGGDFHDWQVLPDSRLALIVGDAQGSTLEASMTAAVVQAAVKTHCLYHEHPEQVVQAVNEFMWSSGMGDQFASLLYGVLNPESWELELALCGSLSAYLLGKVPERVLGVGEPLLGMEPDLLCRREKFRLNPGDGLVVFSEGMKHALLRPGNFSGEDELESFLQEQLRQGCGSLVARLKEIDRRPSSTGLVFDRSVLALRRMPSELGAISIDEASG